MSDSDGSAGDSEHGHSSGFGRMLRNRLFGIARSRAFIIYAVAVVVLAGLYFGLIAAPIYVSYASFTMTNRSPPTASLGGATGIAAAPSMQTAIAGSGASATDQLAEPVSIIDYVQSPQMMHILDRRFHLRELYSHRRVDVFHWMPSGASDETMLNFYRRMVKPTFDQDNLIMRLEVRSFSSQSAHDIAEAVLDLCDAYVDHLSAKIREDTLRTADVEVEKAEHEVQASRLALAKFRGANGVFDPNTAATTQTGQIASLQQALVSARSDRSALTAYSRPDAPLVQQADARIADLQRQGDAAQAQLAGNGHTDTVAQKLYGYTGLQAANDYAEQALTAALQNYDTARVSANQQERFLVRAVNPNYPDSAEEPLRLLGFLIAVIAALALYAAVTLIAHAVRDFRGN